MQRLLIILLNSLWLALLLVGVPAVAGLRLWHWEISSVPVAQRLMFWALALAAAGNGAAALVLVKGRKDRRFCWEWTALFLVLLAAEFSFVRGWINFHWLQHALLWLQKHF